jgi:hypothetical protein
MVVHGSTVQSGYTASKTPSSSASVGSRQSHLPAKQPVGATGAGTPPPCDGTTPPFISAASSTVKMVPSGVALKVDVQEKRASLPWTLPSSVFSSH